MFSKLSIVAAIVPFVSALTLNTPTNLASGGPATISWTAASTDSVFSLELVNIVFHNSFAIANNVQPTVGSVTLNLPSVPPGDGYTLEAVNIANISDIYTTSGGFSVAAPSSSSLSSTSALSSSSGLSSSGLSSSSSASGSSSRPAASSTSPSSSSSAAAASNSSFSAASPVKFSFTTLTAGSYAVMLLAAVAGAAVVVL